MQRADPTLLVLIDEIVSAADLARYTVWESFQLCVKTSMLAK